MDIPFRKEDLRQRRHFLVVVSAHDPCPDTSKRTAVAAANQLIDILQSIELSVHRRGTEASQQESG